MKKSVSIFLLLTLLLSLNSCFVNRTTVGNGPVGKLDKTVKYSKHYQMYVLWGFLPLKSSPTKVPVECGYQVKTAFDVPSAIVSILTAGIFSMRAEKVLVIRDSQCDPAIIKLEKKLEKKEMQQGR